MTDVPPSTEGQPDLRPSPELAGFFAEIFAISAAVRYVAVGRGQAIALQQRSTLSDASSSVSDRFEELLVNPTLLKLVTQRGDLDCGGVRHVIIGYGHFNQFVLPIDGGHVSIAFDRAPIRWQVTVRSSRRSRTTSAECSPHGATVPVA